MGSKRDEVSPAGVTFEMDSARHHSARRSHANASSGLFVFLACLVELAQLNWISRVCRISALDGRNCGVFSNSFAEQTFYSGDEETRTQEEHEKQKIGHRRIDRQGEVFFGIYFSILRFE